MHKRKTRVKKAKARRLWAVCANVDQSWSRINESWIKQTIN